MERCTLRHKGLNYLIAHAIALTIFIGVIPANRVQAAPTDKPTINGKAGITIDMKTGEIIYDNNIDQKMYPASITKLMTALLFAESKSKTDNIKYTASAKAQPTASLGTDIMTKLAIGDTMTGEDVMKALLVFSANDSAYMVADAVAGDATKFAKMMNERGAKLNLKGTNIVSANGLHDINHYTTPYDISLLGRAAYSNPWIKEVLGIKKDTIRTSSGIVAIIENRNKLLGVDGNLGGKTGYTEAAGRCLVSFYERDGRSMIGVIMRSAYDSLDSMVFKDMETIINWSYNAKPTILYKKDDLLDTKTLTYKPLKYFGPEKTISVPVIIREEVNYYENVVNKNELKKEILLDDLNPWNLTSGSKIGTISIKERESNKVFELYTTASSKDLINVNKSLYLFTGIAAILILVLILFIVLLVIRGVNKRRRHRY